MSRKASNGSIQYTIGEKIEYYQNKLKQKNLKKGDKAFFMKRIQELKAMKQKYGVVYIEDERFFDSQTRDGHHYLISKLDKDENMSTYRVTHHEKGNRKLNGFDGRSYLKPKIITKDSNGKVLNANDAYTSIFAGKVDLADKALVDELNDSKKKASK